MNAKKSCLLGVVFAAILAIGPRNSFGETIDGRVVQVKLPAEDATLFYVEARAVFTVALKTKSATVEAQEMYIGDGEVAIDLVAHPINGIFLQGQKYRQGEKFKQGSTIKVLPGYKKATDLKPGDLYVVLPNVSFDMPKKQK